MSFFKDMVEKIKDEDTTLASDGTGSAEFGSFIDSGSYILTLYSRVASMGAYLIIRLLLLQESPLLVKLSSFLVSLEPSLTRTQQEQSSTTIQKQRLPEQ